MASKKVIPQTVRYIGDGAWLPGVPARDLSTEEWEQYKDTILASSQAAQLYQLPARDSEEGVTNG